MASKVYPCLLWNMEILFASNNRMGQKQCHGTPEAPSERPEGRTWIVWGCLPGEDTDVQTKGPQWTDRWEPGPAVQLSCVSWRLQSPLTMLADTTKPEPGLNCHKARNKLESFCTVIYCVAMITRTGWEEMRADAEFQQSSGNYKTTR